MKAGRYSGRADFKSKSDSIRSLILNKPTSTKLSTAGGADACNQRPGARTLPTLTLTTLRWTYAP
ncbi:hypothetical protein J6590_009150 [Homalodisca vitripennis]|nr:hypothetical protein J6590_009150 [Homalodisca vitripennis]